MAIQLKDGHFENEDSSVRVSSETAGWFFEQKDALRIQVSVSAREQPPVARIGIYGTPDGLRQLADLITAIASVDQSKIPNTNCPPNEGIHATIHAGTEFLGSHVVVNVGRLDRKSDGGTNWFLIGEDVSLDLT
ncbi:MAG: hypothetical protein AAFN77_12005 [Planctomycetota bacterium]